MIKKFLKNKKAEWEMFFKVSMGVVLFALLLWAVYVLLNRLIT